MSMNHKESGRTNRARAIAIPAPRTWSTAEIAGFGIAGAILMALGGFIWLLLRA